jgi:HAD superfamily hydrolase (TIGR01450 family)
VSHARHEAAEAPGLRERLAAVGGVLFDVDGTLLRPQGPTIERAELLPGAAEVLRRLKDGGVAVVCYTSGTSATPAAYAARLRSHGLPVDDEEMLTPAVVAALRLERDAPGSRVLALGGRGLTGPLARAGVALVAPADANTRADVVLVGYDHDLTADRLVSACHAVWSGAALWTTTLARSYARSGGRGVGLPGAITAGIQHVTGAPVVNVGKPSAVSMKVVSEWFGVPYERILVVGDDQDIEVRMGRDVGALTALVLTGTTGAHGVETLERYPPEERPDLVLDDVGGLLDRLQISPGA